jgi:hypothetical protein
MTSTAIQKLVGIAAAIAAAATLLVVGTAASARTLPVHRYGPHDPWFNYAVSHTRTTNVARLQRRVAPAVPWHDNAFDACRPTRLTYPC